MRANSSSASAASAKDEAAWIMQHFLGATLCKGTPEVYRMKRLKIVDDHF
jgi:hypothetical protein